MGNVCPQIRCYHPHYEKPERMFYFKEFREDIEFIKNDEYYLDIIKIYNLPKHFTIRTDYE